MSLDVEAKTAKDETCPVCNGSGEIACAGCSDSIWPGDCARCHGRRKVACPACHGTGIRCCICQGTGRTKT